MNRIIQAALAAGLLFAVGCGGDPCAQLTTDICGDKGADCAEVVKKDLLEGKGDKATCEFLVKDADYQKWLKAAKASVEEKMKK